MKTDQNTTIIKPNTRLLDIPISELIRYKGLIYYLVKRNFDVSYKQTILGKLWLFIGIIFSSGIFSFVLGSVGGFDAEGAPYFIFCMLGTLIWDYFTECFESNKRVFLENSSILGKVYFPRLAIPIANLIYQTLRLFLRFLVVLAFLAYYLYSGQIVFTGLKVFWAILCVISMGLMGAGLGLICSCMTVRYRDVNNMTKVLLQLVMFVSPVLYSANQMSPSVQRILYINPVSGLVELFRYSFLGIGILNVGSIIYGIVFQIAALAIGIIWFNQIEKTFIDTI